MFLFMQRFSGTFFLLFTISILVLSWQLLNAKRQIRLFRLEQEEMLQKAKGIHKRSLPARNLEEEDLLFSSYYLPAHGLGGDLFGIIPLLHENARERLVFMADVSGHGLDSAVMAMFIRDTMEEFLLLHSDPRSFSTAELLEFVDSRYRLEGFPLDYLVSLVVGLFCPLSNQITYSSVGFGVSHLVVSYSGDVFELSSGRLPLSTAIPKELMDFSGITVELSAGSSLVFFTDGVYSQVQGETMYGKRLYRVLSEHSLENPRVLLETVVKDFHSFLKGESVLDDTSIMVLRKPIDEEEREADRSLAEEEPQS